VSEGSIKGFPRGDDGDAITKTLLAPFRAVRALEREVRYIFTGGENLTVIYLWIGERGDLRSAGVWIGI